MLSSRLPAHFPSPGPCSRDMNVQQTTTATRPVPFRIGPNRVEVVGIPILHCRGCKTATYAYDLELLAEVEAALARHARRGHCSSTYTFQELSSELVVQAA